MRSRRAVKQDGPAEARERRSALAGVAKAFKDFRPAREALKVVRAVPTRFVQFDHAVRVGGMPVERFMLMHGPSGEGKSLMSIGIVDSFLERDHFALYIDAERTTPITWARDLMGKNAEHPGFYAERPDSYEETIDRVRKFLNLVASVKTKGQVPPETCAVVVVDSLRKLVPKNLLDQIIKYEADEEKKRQQGKKTTAGNDRGGQIRAKMNAAWMDELVPLLDHAGACFVAIAREMVDPDADPMARKFGRDFKVGGGGAIYYEASLDMRVERASWVYESQSQQDKDDEKKAKVFGERHRVTIKKTKVAGKEDKHVTAYFHSSNGNLVPAGFDRARDVLDLAKQFGLAKIGSHTSWGDKRSDRVQGGMNSAVKKLTAEPEALAALEQRVREHFPHKNPTEYDPLTGELGK